MRSAIDSGTAALFFSDLLSGNRKKCSELVERLLEEEIDIFDLYINLFQRSLYEVGGLWERNAISVAVEHMATSITEQLLTLVYPRLFATPRLGKRVVVSCVANEYHQIGGKMVADIMELRGYDSLFLGANTPLADLVALIDDSKPDMVGLSLSVSFNLGGLVDILCELTARFPDLPFLVGGQAFRFGGRQALARFPNVTHVASLHDLDNLLAEARP